MSRSVPGNGSAGVIRLRRLFVAVAALLVVGVVIGVARFDFGDKLTELTLPLRHDDIIRQQAAEKDVPADLIAAVIYEESQFDDDIRSDADARGLMQITPATADTIEKLSGGTTFVYDDLSNPDLNIRYGTFYLAYLLDKYDGDVVATLAAYNAGEGNADAWGGAGMKIDDIEFPETYEYVKDVLARRAEYRKKYPEELGLR
jgi:peptidoglycan lytic transglycosylase